MDSDETLKQKTAFAYGHALVMLQATTPVVEDRLILAQKLVAALRHLGILAADGKNVTQAYYSYQVNGAFAAAEELEKES